MKNTSPSGRDGLTLQACAVNIVRYHPEIRDEGELIELIKQLAIRRGIRWSYGHELTAVLERAKRYA